MEHIRSFVLIVSFSAAACGGGGTPAPVTTPEVAAPVEAAPVGGTPPVGGTLIDLQNGDRACYVVLATDAGEVSLEGDFELCAGGGSDATSMVGQRVVVTTRKANVQAASCQGDPSYSESDEVDLVVSIQAAP